MTLPDIKRLIRPGRGAADITPLLLDAAAFHACIDALAAPFDAAGIDAVGCIEGRGFLLGAAVAYRLGAGALPMRDPARLKAAAEPFVGRYVDYSRREKALAVASDALAPGARVLLVDDWVETGATLRAAIHLVRRAGGVVAGVAALIDDTGAATRAFLSPYRYHWLAQTAPGDDF